MSTQKLANKVPVVVGDGLDQHATTFQIEP
jgi:hypothetical protein